MKTTSVQEALSIIVRLAGSQSWVLGGSASLLLQGLSLNAPPRDIDLYCDAGDVAAIHQALISYTIDAPSYSETDIYRSTLSHYRIGPVQVELVGGFSVRARGCYYSVDVKNMLLPYGKTVELEEQLEGRNTYVQVVPLAHELWFNTLRQREDRAQVIAAEMRKQPYMHWPALAAIEDNNDLASDVIGEVHQRIDGLQEGERLWMRK